MNKALAMLLLSAMIIAENGRTSKSTQNNLLNLFVRRDDPAELDNADPTGNANSSLVVLPFLGCRRVGLRLKRRCSMSDCLSAASDRAECLGKLVKQAGLLTKRMEKLLYEMPYGAEVGVMPVYYRLLEKIVRQSGFQGDRCETQIDSLAMHFIRKGILASGWDGSHEASRRELTEAMETRVAITEFICPSGSDEGDEESIILGTGLRELVMQ